MNIKDIKHGVILAAGEGKRLRDGTRQTCSKPMTMVAGKPLVCYGIDAMLAAGIDIIIIVYSEHTKDMLALSEQNAAYKKALNFVRFEGEGKIKTLLCAERHVQTPFVVAYGDAVIQADFFLDMLKGIDGKHADAFICTVDNPSIPIDEVKQPWDRSIFVKDGRVIKWYKGGVSKSDDITEEDSEECGKAGGMIYVYNVEPFIFIKKRLAIGKDSHAGFIAKFIEQHNVLAMLIEDIWDIDYAEDLARTEELLNQRRI